MPDRDLKDRIPGFSAYLMDDRIIVVAPRDTTDEVIEETQEWLRSRFYEEYRERVTVIRDDI